MKEKYEYKKAIVENIDELVRTSLSGRLGCPPPFECHTPGADLG